MIIFTERTDGKCNNDFDHPVTVFREYKMIPKESIMIFRRPEIDDEEFGNPFRKSNLIPGKPKSIFSMAKNTFAKIKHYIYLFRNQFAGRNLQGAVYNLQFAGNKLKFYGKNLKG